MEDLEKASQLLVQALELREQYMQISQQSFPQCTAKFLRSMHEKNKYPSSDITHEDRKTIAGMYYKYIHIMYC